MNHNNINYSLMSSIQKQKQKEKKTIYEKWIDQGFNGNIEEFKEIVLSSNALDLWKMLGNKGNIDDFVNSK